MVSISAVHASQELAGPTSSHRDLSDGFRRTRISRASPRRCRLRWPVWELDAVSLKLGHMCRVRLSLCDPRQPQVPPGSVPGESQPSRDGLHGSATSQDEARTGSGPQQASHSKQQLCRRCHHHPHFIDKEPSPERVMRKQQGPRGRTIGGWGSGMWGWMRGSRRELRTGKPHEPRERSGVNSGIQP